METGKESDAGGAGDATSQGEEAARASQESGAKGDREADGKGKETPATTVSPTKSRHSAPSATNIGKTRRARRRTFSRC